MSEQAANSQLAWRRVLPLCLVRADRCRRRYRTFGLLLVACFLAGLSEANISVAQSAIADIAPAQQRSRLLDTCTSARASRTWRARWSAASSPTPSRVVV